MDTCMLNQAATHACACACTVVTFKDPIWTTSLIDIDLSKQAQFSG